MWNTPDLDVWEYWAAFHCNLTATSTFSCSWGQILSASRNKSLVAGTTDINDARVDLQLHQTQKLHRGHNQKVVWSFWSSPSRAWNLVGTNKWSEVKICKWYMLRVPNEWMKNTARDELHVHCLVIQTDVSMPAGGFAWGACESSESVSYAWRGRHADPSFLLVGRWLSRSRYLLFECAWWNCNWIWAWQQAVRILIRFWAISHHVCCLLVNCGWFRQPKWCR